MIRPIEEKDNLPLAKMIRRVFDEHDAPQKGTVYSDPTTDDLYALFRIPKSILWVAEIDNEVIGCCGVYVLFFGCFSSVFIIFLSAYARTRLRSSVTSWYKL